MRECVVQVPIPAWSKFTSQAILVLHGSAFNCFTCFCVTLWTVLDRAIGKVNETPTPSVSNCLEQRAFYLIDTKLCSCISVAITSFVPENPCKVERAKEKCLMNTFKCQELLLLLE